MKSPGVSIFRRVVKWWPWRLAMISLLLFAALFFIYGHKDLAEEKPVTKRNFTLDGHKDLATEKPIIGRNFALDGHKDLATEKPISGRNFTLGGGMVVTWEGFGPEKGRPLNRLWVYGISFILGARTPLTANPPCPTLQRSQ